MRLSGKLTPVNPSQSADILTQNSGDKFGFSLFVAAAVHAMLILGISFTRSETAGSAPSLAVTLVAHQSFEQPPDADFLAQNNQQASGTEAEPLLPTNTELSPFIGPDTSHPKIEQRRAGLPNENLQALSALGNRQIAQAAPQENQQGDSDRSTEQQQDAQSLLAQLDSLRQEYAQRPKIGTLTSVAAQASDDAAYQMMLQERIVATGNRNYPTESLQRQLFGSVRLKLQILPDGKLETAEILESSGHLVLDRAAVDIARMAGPFPAFPSELRNKYDKIIFIRSWQFLPGGSITTNQ